MTKAELEIKYKEALEKLKEQEHLASAVESKDREIAELNKKHREAIERVQNNLYKRIQKLEQELYNSKVAVNNDVTKVYEDRIKALEDEVERRVMELNQIIRNHGSLLKTLQGTIETSIELNDFMFKKFTGGE